MYKAIIFDCDGVLVDSEKGLSEISAAVLTDYFGLPAVPADFMPFIGMGEDMYIGEVVRKYSGIYTPEIKSTIYNEYIARAPGVVKTFEGLAELLLKLKSEGYLLAVASSADVPKVNVNLSILGLGYDFFDAIITGSDVSHKKPDPEIYLLAASRFDINKSECVIVEDAISGVLSGINAGIDVIGFTSSVSAGRLLGAGAKVCIDDVNELYGVLQ
ncbi:MAG: HAD family hydrolase [Saccharofermentanales bacterium]